MKLWHKAIFATLLLAVSNVAFADASDVMIRNFDYIARAMQAISIAMGLGLFLGGIFQLKRYGEMRTMMSAQMSLSGPLMMVVAGCALLILPTFIEVLMLSFWGTRSPLAYTGQGLGWRSYLPAIVLFVRIIGIGSIMRGIVLLSRAGHSGQTQPGTVSKAFVHLFGGVLAVNVVGTMHILRSLFGFPV